MIWRPLLALGRSAKRLLGRGTLTFGLREATIVAAIGVTVTILVVWAELH